MSVVPSPPAWAVRLLETRLSGPDGGYLMGDLEERFRDLVRTDSLARARRWYARQALFAAILGVPGMVRRFGSGWELDLRSAARGLTRHPAQTLVAVATLGLGIGATGGAFSVLRGTVLRGLPFAESERLVHFERANPSEDRLSMAVTPHDYVAWREGQRTFEDLGAYVEATALLPSPGALPERLIGVRISASSFPLLRVGAARGRVFSAADEAPGAPAVVLLSHALWTTRFGADPSIVGQEIRLNDGPVTVIGVMAEGFGFPIAEAFWLPLRLDLAAIPRGSGRLDVFGRLHAGSDMAAGRADFAGVGNRLAAAFPATNAGIEPVLRTFQQEYVGAEFARTVAVLMLAAALLLLICCANVSNLLLVRGQERRDLAVRAALGAGRARLVRPMLIEALLLAAGGGLLGLIVAFAGVRSFEAAGARNVFDLPHGPASLFWWDVRLDMGTFLFVLGVSLVTALVAGTAPALRASRTAPSGGLRDAGRLASSRSFARFAGGMVVLELVLTTGLLVTAGFALASVRQVLRAGSAVSGDGVAVLRLDLAGGDRYASLEAQFAFLDGLTEALGGVGTDAVLATSLPLVRPRMAPLALTPDATTALPDVPVVTIGPGYFRAFGVAPIEGREFTSADAPGAPPVAIVNTAFVERYLGGGPALAARFRLGEDPAEPWVQIVGVVPDLWNDGGRPERAAGVYVAAAQPGTDPSVRLGPWGLAFPTLIVGSSRPVVETMGRIRSALYAADPSLPIPSLRAFTDVSAANTDRYHVWSRFYLALAVAALFVSALGVYGVLSFRVASRTAEIGVRRALGATDGDVRRDVLGQAGRATLVGISGGLLLGHWLTRGLTQILYDVDTADPRIFVAVALVLAGTGLFASWVPARRAAHIDPARAMRAD